MFARVLVFSLALAAVSQAAPPVIPGLSAHPDLAASAAGSLLLGELNCTACHGEGPNAAWIDRKQAPSLVTAGMRIRPAYLERFIANPHQTKPGTTMPAMLDHLDEPERRAAAKALTHYLVRTSPKPAPDPPVETASESRGKILYHTVGCVACHDPEGKTLPNSMPLGAIEEKYHLAELVQYLENPLAIRPGGRMPDLGLTHWEAIDLASYLLRNQPEEDALPFELDNKLADRGAELFTSLGCANCHRADGAAKPTAPPLLPPNLTAGCLSGKTGAWPNYELKDKQRDAIAAAVKAERPPPNAHQQIELILTRHNCIACHQRDDYGGIADERRSYFTTTNANLGEQASIPPALTLAGQKFKPEALHKILSLGTAASVRPYMNTRMPRFGKTNLEALPDLFAMTDHLPAIDIDRVKDPKEARQAGVDLVGSKGLGCVACHTWDGKTASTLEGMDLTVIAPRLQETWFHYYLRDPQRFHPQTIMPSYWPGGKSVRPETLGGDPSQQIDAIWRYLSQGRQGRQPQGLTREPLPVVVGKEAVMLRRSYPGIGKRGIGVGYPKKLNLSFDAGQMRLGSIWRGEFIEASAVWRSQGSGNVREMGSDVIRFPVGPAFALLPDPNAPWPADEDKKAKGFQFGGYSLDQLQRPTFRYSFAGSRFVDRFLDELDEGGQPYFQRTLAWTHDRPPAGLHLRLAVDKAIVAKGDKTYQVGTNLLLKLSAEGRVRNFEKGQELLVPLAGLNKFTVEYHWISQP